MKILFWTAFLGLLFPAGTEAIDLSASGGLMRIVNASHLVAGAGSNLHTTFDDSAATSLSIVDTSGSSDHWRIDVRRSDATWHNALGLYVKRISDGSGSGTVTGGLSHVEISGTEVEFFSGEGDRTGLFLSYELTGMSVAVSPNTYSTTVIFTIVDTP
ncbi:MAG: hypothetical protein Q7U02_14865 [Desulfosalsimonadaceae bacterium]|nr:hypothetical protein [Desulfosalsimonadaceae bacterium]